MYKCSIISIRLETCYKNEPLSKIKCVFCSSSSVKHEKHFLSGCQNDNIRKKYFDRLYNDHHTIKNLRYGLFVQNVKSRSPDKISQIYAYPYYLSP